MENKANPVSKLKRKNTLIAWSFIAPNFIGFLLFTLIPVVFSLILAFMKWDSFSTPEFIGLKNFSKMMTDETFWISLKNTFLYTIGVVPLTLVCSLGLAILLNQKIRGVKFFRTAFFFPYVTSLVAIAVVWNMLFHPTMGPINQFLKLFIANPPGWVSSSQWALTAIIIVSVWRGMGYYMILYLAGLQSISKELYEAAAMDGANKWKQFVNITVPALRPTTFFVTIMLVINCFKIFDLVQVMTDGGPGRATNVLVYHVYNEAFVKFNFGYASAIAMILFVIVLAITVIQFKWNQVQERV
ncbi:MULTISPECIES: carbohydrate ABC transporter permease [Enterococcus]|uniref:ABC transporter permease n=1 Tax=Enterococcus thailandicus TaxID=417368 RepID=A0A179ESZ3_ENTTH|nr:MULTISPECIES: sugar ABC transporter permease [Enterococcus]ASZ07369.1 sugar ABC transporter permease [Enterococcus thailandicus]MDA3966025.1 sugar ABC transporter permease [Enterococcus thailandicus]MDA3972815.1 sugar ABC transporter permease [Enterococcus thailandicus]MDA3975311.1 sugar ABC transporter permease [Enterococcus thailandicus]MDA3980275.1 sugar ABC transporter permease [Enterococcus thailandicus]